MGCEIFLPLSRDVVISSVCLFRGQLGGFLASHPCVELVVEHLWVVTCRRRCSHRGLIRLLLQLQDEIVRAYMVSIIATFW